MINMSGLSDTDDDGEMDAFEANDTSTVPSLMDLNDLMIMALSASTSEITVATPKLDLPSTQESVTKDRTSGVSSSPDEKINYSKRIDERIGSLLDTGILSDVTFLVGEGKREIRSHKLILALSSPVFASMFYSTLLESQCIIEIPDCEADAFQALLDYIYKGDCFKAFSQGNLHLGLAALYTARKYAVKGFEDICLVIMSSLINVETVFEISNAANLHSLSNLESECWEYIEDNTELVLKSHLENMESDLIVLLLKNERLNIREAKLFELIHKWIEQTVDGMGLTPTKENKMKIGGNALELIRYPIMSSTEFAEIVVPTDILSVNQIAKIFTYISTSQERREQFHIDMEFSVKERTPRIIKRNKKKSKMKHSTFVAFSFDRNGNNSDANIPPTTASSTEDQPQEQDRAARRSNRRARRRNRSQNQIHIL